jgi:3-oxoacyl-[acyl-carrier-protein] synthase-3
VAAALAGQDKAVLLLSAEVRSKFRNSEDFATATLFGDGAAGCVVSVAPGAKGFRVIASQIFSDGSVGDVISVPSGGSLSPAATETDKTKFYLKMKDGAEIFFKAVEGMREAGVHFLQNCGMGVGDIQWLVPHQANGFLIEALGDKLEIPKEKVVNVIQNMGNTSGATVGIALSFLLENPNLKSGDKVLLLAAGGGGLAACALLEYSA